MSKITFWERYKNDKHFVCAFCKYSTYTATAECPVCNRKMINFEEIKK